MWIKLPTTNLQKIEKKISFPATPGNISKILREETRQDKHPSFLEKKLQGGERELEEDQYLRDLEDPSNNCKVGLDLDLDF